MSKRQRNTAAKQAAKEEKRKRDKRIRLTVLAVLAALLLVAGVTVLLSRIPRYAVLEGENGRYRDRTTDTVYLAAPVNYEPTSRRVKAYAKRGDYFVYPITGQSAALWLTEDRDGLLQVYYNENVTLPALEDFKPSTVRIDRDEAVVSHINVIDKADEVAAIVNAVLYGEETELPAESTAVYTLRITSSEYTWLTYGIAYVVTEEGAFYADRCTGRTVKADGPVASYLETGGSPS